MSYYGGLEIFIPYFYILRNADKKYHSDILNSTL